MVEHEPSCIGDARIDRDDPRLPPAYAHVQPSPRPLHASGDPSLLWRGTRIGVIGSRTPRADAAAVARRIAFDAASAGFTVVSGLAIGIDAVAHRAALDAGGVTIAVIAGGLARVQPASNRRLAREIAGHGPWDGPGRVPAGVDAGVRRAPGVVITEHGAGDEPSRPFQFALRNRVIAALCDYLVVVQARRESGSMITAEHALRLGIQVGVLPSAPDDPCHAGATALIMDGADAVVDGTSLFRRLELHGVMRPGFADAATNGARVDPDVRGAWIEPATPEQLELADDPIAAMLATPRTTEDLAELCGCTRASMLVQLIDLEERRLATRLDDGTWLRRT